MRCLLKKFVAMNQARASVAIVLIPRDSLRRHFSQRDSFFSLRYPARNPEDGFRRNISLLADERLYLLLLAASAIKSKRERGSSGVVD